MFRIVDFQYNCFIAIFLYSMFTIWKKFLQTCLNHVPEGLYDKGQNIWKSSRLSTKTTLTIKRRKEILRGTGLRSV